MACADGGLRAVPIVAACRDESSSRGAAAIGVPGKWRDSNTPSGVAAQVDRMSRMRTDRIALGLLFLAGVISAFLYGVAAARYRLFPFDFVEPGYAKLEESLAMPHMLCPIRYEETGVKIHDRGAMAPGLTLLTSYWPYLPDNNWTPGIKLIDADGHVLWSWRVPKVKNRASLDPWLAWHAGGPYVHGSYLFDNGDVVFSSEYIGLYRMNAAGRTLWSIPHTHHSVFRDEDGNFWVSAARRLKDDAAGRKRAADFPGLRLPFFEDRLLKVSPDGKILKDISVLKILYRSGNQRRFWKTRTFSGDLCHLNDVEVLSHEMADQYPMFDAGDLVFSLRSPDFVGVVDPDTEEVKWSATEPFLAQHDPDFIGDGWIGIFDNNDDRTDEGSILGGSRIIAIKPQTNELRLLYPRSGSQRFYTKSGGKWQQLDNGNLLITQARAGRVFEVDAQGRLVWEWFHEHFDDKYVVEVLEGTRYNITHQQVAVWHTK